MFKQKRLEAKKLIYVLLAVIVVIVYFKSVQAREVFSADSYEDIKDGTKISYQSDNDETEIIGYHFNLDKDAKCTFKGKYSTDLTIIFNLIDDNKNKILWSSVGLGSKDLDFSVYLKKGDYYFNLEKFCKTELSLDFNIEYLENSDIENNDTIETAQAIDCGKSQSGAFLYNDYVDVYKFEVPYSGEVTYGVSVESSCGSLLLDSSSGWSSMDSLELSSQVYDSKGEKVNLSYSESDGKYHMEKLNAGTYYLEISKPGSNNTPSMYGISYSELCGTYKFDIELEPLGNNFSTYEGYKFYKDEKGNVRCFDSSNNLVINEFKCDGTYTYYFQLDGTAMKDRLTYHPDGVHIIYFDAEGHEVFSDFTNIKTSIAGDPVDDLCFFDVYGYMYVDVLTYNKEGTQLYYANPYGVMECMGWFQFSDNAGGVAEAIGAKKGVWGYANADGHIDFQSIGDFDYISANYGVSRILSFSDGEALVTGIDINYKNDHNYYRYETEDQAILADAYAKYYADHLMMDPYLETDLDKVRQAALITAAYSLSCEYNMDAEKHYQSPYGVFCAGVYTCAGSTRALGRILDYMGYSWTFINENQYDHQFCELYMDGKIGVADGMMGGADYISAEEYLSGEKGLPLY